MLRNCRPGGREVTRARGEAAVKRDPWLLSAVLASLLVCGLAARTQLELVNPYRFADLGHQLFDYELTWRGGIPYLDFWTNWWGPASFYLNAGAFAALGPSLLSANQLLALVIAISAIALYALSRRIVPRPLAFAISAVALLWGNLTLNLPYSGWYANAFGLLALLAFARHLESERRGLAWLVATGFLLGLAFSAKQHVGILSLAAIALAAALGPAAPAGPAAPEPAGRPAPAARAAGRSRRSPLLARLAAPALLVPGAVVLPGLVLAERLRAGLAPDTRTLLLFVLPALAANAVAGLALREGFRAGRGEAEGRAWLAALLARELALLAGFALAVAPWVAWFSSRLGWGDFPRLLLLAHPLQATFKRAYLTILTDPPFPRGSAVFLTSLLVACAASALLFRLATSRGRLLAATGASGALALAFLLLALPIGPELGRRLGFPSDFDPRVFTHCESAELIGPLFYTPLLLGGALLAGLLARGRGAPAARVGSRPQILLFALAAYAAYGLLALLSFVDRAHFQMAAAFPWLPLVGFVGLHAHRALAGRLPEPGFAPRGRRGGILLALAVLLGTPFAGKALFILHLQIDANRDYAARQRPAGSAPAPLFSEIRHPKARGVLVSRDLARVLERFLAWIERESGAGELLFGAPSTTLFNFLAGRDFPSKYSYFLFDALSEPEQGELLAELRARPPKLHLLDDFYNVPVSFGDPAVQSTERQRFSRDFAQLEQYLARHFEPEGRVERFHLYRRREAAP